MLAIAVLQQVHIFQLHISRRLCLLKYQIHMALQTLLMYCYLYETGQF